MSHTPTPWKVAPGHAPTSVTVRSDGEPSLPVAEIWHSGVAPEANAAFIVRACNAHDDLVLALNRLHSLIDFDLEWGACGCFPEPDAINDALKQAKVALAKAEGRTP